MSRLVDADALIELLRNNMSNDIQDQIITENNINLIHSAPTAYSIEKVVAELEKRKALYNSLWADCRNELAAEYNLGRHDAILGAIEIVKAGGKHE